MGRVIFVSHIIKHLNYRTICNLSPLITGVAVAMPQDATRIDNQISNNSQCIYTQLESDGTTAAVIWRCLLHHLSVNEYLINIHR